MAPPRRPTHTGLDSMIVQIEEIDAKANAHCIDQFGRHMAIPITVTRGKGARPAVGDLWVIDRTIGNRWSFAAVLNTVPPAVTGSRGANAALADLLDALDAAGLVDDQTTAGSAPGGGGVTDHGGLTGLGDDDHPQYLTEAEADALYDSAGSASSAQGFAIQRSNHTGTQSLDTTTDSATRLAMTSAERSKLSGIATGATANSSDAVLLDRANHTGTQAISTVSGLQEAVDGARLFTSGRRSGVWLHPYMVRYSNAGTTIPSGAMRAMFCLNQGPPMVIDQAMVDIFTGTANTSAVIYICADSGYLEPAAGSSFLGTSGTISGVSGGGITASIAATIPSGPFWLLVHSTGSGTLAPRLASISLNFLPSATSSTTSNASQTVAWTGLGTSVLTTCPALPSGVYGTSSACRAMLRTA